MQLHSLRTIAKLLCAAGFLACLAVFSPAAFATAISVWTRSYDNSRTGANLSETTLTTANVNQTQFGKLFSCAVDGCLFAQPLYIPALTINGGTHNVVFCATAANSLYAFDADSGAQLWHVNYGTPPQESDVEVSGDIVGPIGIIGTPVIDTSTNTLYLVERNKNTDGTFHQYLRAVDVTTGADKFSSPKEIAATISGYAFDPKIQNQRPALTLANGTVYIAWASHNDLGAYKGWVMGYQASDVANQQYTFIDTSGSGTLGGIWMCGQGLIVDSSNDIYFITGNGTFDGTGNFGDSFVKLSPTLTVLDYFSPSNQATLSANDTDLGSGGDLMIPGTSDLCGGGKDGRLFLLSSTNLGHYNATTDQVLQEFATGTGLHMSPVYYNTPNNGPTVYVWEFGSVGEAYKMSGGLFDTTPTSQTAAAASAKGSGEMAISSNNGAAGSGILWGNVANGDAADGSVPGTLYAYDATNLGTMLWNSKQNTSRDDYGDFAKNTPPMIVNGKVYMATFSNALVVYGELGPPTPPATPTNVTATPASGQVTVAWSAGTGATSYSIFRSTASGAEGTSAIATTGSTSYVNTGLTNGVKYYYKVSAANTAGTSVQSAEVSATPTASTTSVTINCGAGAVSPFIADTYFSGGTTINHANTINTTGVTNPAPAAVYQTARVGNFTYTVPGFVAGSSHTVRLHMCETYFNATGKRTFNVSINGTQVLANFDIYKTAGAENKALVEPFTENANSSGQYVIQFTEVINQSLISGIEVD